MDSVITISPIHTPYLLHFGKQFFVIVEKEVVLEVTDFSRAMSALFACYYIFDISYPKECIITLLFLERFMFNIVNGPKLSKTAIGVISDIQKIKL